MDGRENFEVWNLASLIFYRDFSLYFFLESLIYLPQFSGVHYIGVSVPT